jgi:hypothetical protein
MCFARRTSAIGGFVSRGAPRVLITHKLTDGSLAIWLMNGATCLGSADIY